ncbi:unnamed protein product [Boreogadus saida]
MPIPESYCPPAACLLIAEDALSCVREKGEPSCGDLVEAFQVCVKTLSEGS